MERELSVIDPDKIEFIPVDSLQKIFMKKDPMTCKKIKKISGLKGEHISFQLAYRYNEFFYSSQMRIQRTKNPCVRIEVYTKAKTEINIRRVICVPSAYPAYGESDENYISTEPGLYPDLLENFDGKFQLIPYYWRSLWVELDIAEDAQDGDYAVNIVLRDLDDIVVKKEQLELHIVNAILPKQDVIHTEWFYSDCLSDYYHIPVFSEEYWRITENFMKTAVKRGINMILTPLFTLPLDTLIGKERTTVQLVGVKKTGSKYTFDFRELDRWIELAEKCQYEYFEMGHLFSQWGAKYAPKIIATENGKEKQIFGWNTKANSREYQDFLCQFLPVLVKYLKKRGIAERTYFHISDEPNNDNIDTYREARECVREYLKDFPVIDALSNISFYKEGIVDYPVPTNQHVLEFLAQGMKHPWVYYCSGEYMDVSNRFFAMPSFRNRILGIQLYLYEIEGFLHWGYNYYNSQYSIRRIDPYRVTDADDAFPSGDSFLVYPGEDGNAVESLRLLVLEEGFEDYRALKLLEQYKGKKYVHSLVNQIAGMDITFEKYPTKVEFFENLRTRVNKELDEI